MNSLTKTVTINAPFDKVFGFVSKEENLPKWAIKYCKGIRKEGDDYIISTPEGDSYFHIEACDETGVVDMYGGPTKEEMVRWPSRVAGLPDGNSLYMFTCLQTPDINDDMFEMHCQTLETELQEIKQQVEN